MTELAAPQQPAQQPQKRHQVSLVVSTDLSRRCLFRKYLYQATGRAQEDIILFSRSYWVLVGVCRELQCLLTHEINQLRPCQQGHCRMQAQADALVNISYEYFASILELFKITPATETAGLVIYKKPSDYLRVHADHQGAAYYLHADEVAQLVTLVNEAVASVLKRSDAHFLHQDQDADQVPAIRLALKQHDCDSLIHLPLDTQSGDFRRARYWTDLHGFFLPELQLEHTRAQQVSLSYCSSERLWYCGRCLSRRIEDYCTVASD